MDRMQIKGEWNVVKGKIKQQWAMLVEDDLTRLEGRRDELIGRLQLEYGRLLDRVDHDAERFGRLPTDTTARQAWE